MKRAIIKIIIFIVLVLYVAMSQFILVVPFLGVLLLVFLSNIQRIKKSDIATNSYSQRILILALVGAFSLIWSPNPKDAQFQLISLTMLIIASFLLFYFIKKYQCFNTVIFFVLAVSFVNHVGALGIPIFDSLMYSSADGIGTIGYVINGIGWGGRFSGTMQSPNTLAVFLLFSLFLSICVLDNKVGLKLKLNRWVLYTCFINICLCFYTIFMTQSRKGIIFGASLILLYLVINFLRVSMKQIVLYVLGAIALVILINFSTDTSLHFERGLERLEGMGNLLFSDGNIYEVDNSSFTRFYFLTQGWEAFKDKPIFGYGLDSFRYYYSYNAHNNFIELLFGLGIAGFFIYYSIAWSMIKTMAIKWKSNILIIGFIIIELFMDVGHVSYNSKISMFIYITLLLIIDKRISEGNNSTTLQRSEPVNQQTQEEALS